MKLFRCIAIILACGGCVSEQQVFAADYTNNQCPAVSPGGYVNCTFGLHNYSGPVDDTVTMFLGDWPEYYGTLIYAHSKSVAVTGQVGCNRYGCNNFTITSASIDGIPLNPPTSGTTWTLGIDLSRGSHVFAFKGSGTGNWSVSIDGISYTLQPNPPCTGDGCGE